MFPFTWHKARLGLGTRCHWHDTLPASEPVGGRLIRVIIRRNLSTLEALDNIEFLVSQAHILTALLVVRREPCISITFDRSKELVKLIALCRAHHAFTVNVIANVRQVIVPFQRHVANTVRHVFSARVTVVFRLDGRILELLATSNVGADPATTGRAVFVARVVEKARSLVAVDSKAVGRRLIFDRLVARTRDHALKRSISFGIIGHVIVAVDCQHGRTFLIFFVPVFNFIAVEARASLCRRVLFFAILIIITIVFIFLLFLLLFVVVGINLGKCVLILIVLALLAILVVALMKIQCNILWQRIWLLHIERLTSRHCTRRCALPNRAVRSLAHGIKN